MKLLGPLSPCKGTHATNQQLFKWCVSARWCIFFALGGARREWVPKFNFLWKCHYILDLEHCSHQNHVACRSKQLSQVNWQGAASRSLFGFNTVAQKFCSFSQKHLFIKRASASCDEAEVGNTTAKLCICPTLHLQLEADKITEDPLRHTQRQKWKEQRSNNMKQHDSKKKSM